MECAHDSRRGRAACRRLEWRMGESQLHDDSGTRAAPGDAAPPYAGLTPDVVLDALDSARPARRRPPARAQQLREPRLPGRRRGRRRRSSSRSSTGPARWSDAQILEEHAFVARARRARDSGRARRIAFGRPHAASRSRASASRCIRAAAAARPSSRTATTLEWMGRFIGRIHAVGARRAVRAAAGARHRNASATSRATSCSRSGFVPADLLRRVRQRRRRRRSKACAAASSAPATSRTLRLHGDCHAGNVLWTDARAARISSTSTTRAWARRCRTCGCCCRAIARRWRAQLGDLLAGYEEFCEFDRARAAPGRGAAHAAPASTTRRGSRGAGTIPPFPPRFRGSTRSATGRTASSSCASRSPRWTSRRSRCDASDVRAIRRPSSRRPSPAARCPSCTTSRRSDARNTYAGASSSGCAGRSIGVS